MKDDSRIPLVLKFADWPAADRRMWSDLLFKGEAFSEAGSFAGWSEGTQRIRRQGYGEWLSFLARNAPGSLTRPPAERITRSNAEAYLLESEARLAPRSVHNRFLTLLILAEQIVKDCDLSWLRTLVRRLHGGFSGETLKPAPSVSASELFAWSLKRLQSLETDTDLPDVKRAVEYRRALLVGLLIACPIRRRALAGLEVGHLVCCETHFTVRVPAELMKTRRPLEFDLPRQLTSPVTAYLDTHRKLLLGNKASDRLWITRLGDPVSPETIPKELADLTKREFGTPFRSHAFRHIAATSVAETDPEHVGIIRDVLGHATLAMAEKHYNRATTRSAASKYRKALRRTWKAARVRC